MKKVVEKLKSGGVGILPTDTIYGIVGQALSKKAVLRIYKLRKRNPKKPMIILIGSFRDLDLFKVKIDKRVGKVLSKLWPGKVSVILPCSRKEFFYLHRGTKTLAFRLPKPQWLKNLLKKTGPLVAPSANIEGLKPAKTVKEAKKYFGNKVDFYLSRGKLSSKHSTLVSLRNGRIELLRKGAVKISA